MDRQQIFCRGTTLAIDVLSCLSFWMVYDEELGCRVHLGFRNQADRIFKDIQPLLAPTDDKRPTVEVSGHSLGGALTYLIAAKLRKRGYKVVRATSVGAPRLCATAAGASILESLLPRDNLRIENRE
jgi:triacylglycerol lipase